MPDKFLSHLRNKYSPDYSILYIPHRDRTPLTMRTPVGRGSDLPRVEFGTVFVIVSSFVYLAWASTSVRRRLNKAHEKTE